MTIQCDDQGFGEGEVRIGWDELLAVGVRTTADGPFAEDCFLQVLLRNGGFIELPGGLLHGGALESMFAHLEGIDLRELVVAMGSTEERVFRLWHAEESSWPWDDARFGARFAALVERLGGDAARVGDEFRRLRAAWSTPERRYHDLEHLLDCLRELDGAPVERDRADTAELALWYHDVVYEPGRRDCEERSALALLQAASTLRIPRERAFAAAACVRATAHGTGRIPNQPTIDLVLDIDLAILGRDDLRFLEFEYAVAEEYAGVWWLAYVIARGRFLEALLASSAIYRTAHFHQLYEQRARAHLTGLLASPRYRTHRWVSRLRARPTRSLSSDA